MKCPICQSVFEKEASRSLPFCSTRCREIDLARWIDEKYSVTVEKDRELDEFANDDEPPLSRRRRED